MPLRPCVTHVREAAAEYLEQWTDDLAEATVRTMRAMTLWAAMTPGATSPDAQAGAGLAPLTVPDLIGVMLAAEELRATADPTKNQTARHP